MGLWLFKRNPSTYRLRRNGNRILCKSCCGFPSYALHVDCPAYLDPSVPIYNASILYAAGDLVQGGLGGIETYMSNRPNNVGHPLSSAFWWIRVSDTSSDGNTSWDHDSRYGGIGGTPTTYTVVWEIIWEISGHKTYGKSKFVNHYTEDLARKVFFVPFPQACLWWDGYAEIGLRSTGTLERLGTAPQDNDYAGIWDNLNDRPLGVANIDLRFVKHLQDDSAGFPWPDYFLKISVNPDGSRVPPCKNPGYMSETETSYHLAVPFLGLPYDLSGVATIENGDWTGYSASCMWRMMEGYTGIETGTARVQWLPGEVQEFDSCESYDIGDRVTFDGRVYCCIKDNEPGGTACETVPPPDPEYWEEC